MSNLKAENVGYNINLQSFPQNLSTVVKRQKLSSERLTQPENGIHVQNSLYCRDTFKKSQSKHEI
jgi:hypothetical protein